MRVTALQPLNEDLVEYQPGDTLEVTPSRGWRLAELGLVQAAPPDKYDFRDEWGQLRRLIRARPEGILAFETKRRRLQDMRPGESLLVIRKYGGLGDLLISSMLFPELARQYPDIRVTYGVPVMFHPLFEGSGVTLRSYEELWSGKDTHSHRGSVRTGIEAEYDLIEDISIPCHIWENFFVLYGGLEKRQGVRWRNRLDMWSRWMGLVVGEHPTTCIRITADERAAARALIQGEERRSVCLLAPFAANRTKSYPWFRHLALGLRERGYQVAFLHTAPIPDPDFPTLVGLGLRQMGAACAVADLIVSVDSAAFHWGGILGVPTVGVFNVNDGATYCRYYPTARAVQVCDTPCINIRYRDCVKHYRGVLPTVKDVGVSSCYPPETVEAILDALPVRT